MFRRRLPKPDDLFYRRLREAPSRLLLLDYDGTLAPFRREREEAAPYPGVREALSSLMADERGRAIIISGRPLASLERLIDIGPPLELWGSYGWEARDSQGRRTVEPLPDRLRTGLERARAAALAAGLSEHLEMKPVGLALHWRGKGKRIENLLRAGARQAWRELESKGLLELREFDGGVELLGLALDKGTTVEKLLARAPASFFAAYFGDDLADEPAFEALLNRGAGVLVRRRFRPTYARYWVRPPAELLEALEKWRIAISNP